MPCPCSCCGCVPFPVQIGGNVISVFFMAPHQRKLEYYQVAYLAVELVSSLSVSLASTSLSLLCHFFLRILRGVWSAFHSTSKAYYCSVYDTRSAATTPLPPPPTHTQTWPVSPRPSPQRHRKSRLPFPFALRDFGFCFLGFGWLCMGWAGCYIFLS